MYCVKSIEHGVETPFNHIFDAIVYICEQSEKFPSELFSFHSGLDAPPIFFYYGGVQLAFESRITVTEVTEMMEEMIEMPPVLQAVGKKDLETVKGQFAKLSELNGTTYQIVVWGYDSIAQMWEVQEGKLEEVKLPA